MDKVLREVLEFATTVFLSVGLGGEPVGLGLGLGHSPASAQPGQRGTVLSVFLKFRFV